MSKFINRGQKLNYDIDEGDAASSASAFTNGSESLHSALWQEVVECCQNSHNYKQFFPERSNQFNNIKIEYVFMIADFFGVSEIKDLDELEICRDSYDDAKIYYSQKGYQDINKYTPSTFDEWVCLLNECVRTKLEIDVLNIFSNHSTTDDDEDIPDKNSDHVAEIRPSGEIIS